MWVIKDIAKTGENEVHVQYEQQDRFSYKLNSYTLVPGQDISQEEDQVKQFCEELWTEEVVASYRAKWGTQ